MAPTPTESSASSPDEQPPTNDESAEPGTIETIDTDETDDVAGEEAEKDEPGHAKPSRRRTRVVRGVLAAVAVVVVFLVVTGLTGFPAPGALHRYPYSDLRALSEQIDAKAGPLRTPDDCWRTLDKKEGPIREIVRVDYLRSRVVVRGYGSEIGRIDGATFNAIVNAVDEVIASDPRFSWGMVQIEASPDGWSPLVSCRLVTRGWITGF